MNRLHVFIAVVCGLAAIAWLLFRDLSVESLAAVRPTPRMAAGMAMAVAAFAGFNFFQTWRYRILTSLSWAKCFRVNILCEFTSAVTPSAVGGSSLIFVYLNREGMKVGRSTAVMISSLFLDELTMCLGCSLMAVIFPVSSLFGTDGAVSTGTLLVFCGVLSVIAVWTAVLFTALFYKPRWVAKAITSLFSFRLLRRWRDKAENAGRDMETASIEIRHSRRLFWIKAWGATVSAWCCRYAVVNALLFALGSDGNQFLAFARQWVLWIVAIVSPTPGGSGLSEYMFSVYYAGFLDNMTAVAIAALAWRLITYYSYLIAGTIVLPRIVGSKH